MEWNNWPFKKEFIADLVFLNKEHNLCFDSVIVKNVVPTSINWITYYILLYCTSQKRNFDCYIC